MAAVHYITDIKTPRPPRLIPFLILALVVHLALFFAGLLFGGIYGVPGPGGGDALTFQLAAGAANDRFAAPLAPKVTPKPVVAPPKVKPKPRPKPKPKAEVAPRKKKGEAPRPVETKAKEEPQPEMTLEEELAMQGAAGGKGQGARGQALETFKNKKGTSLTGAQISTQMPGREFLLNIFGRGDIQGVNNDINTVIKLNPDGTSDIELTHYYFQTYHDQYSSTRKETGTGRWWVEGNRWCHQAPIINYDTKDCYDLTISGAGSGAELRLYYAPCTLDSSQLCKSGRLAGIGRVQ